jgi:membrane protein implicated in regulation of membrane protease activity
MNNLLGIGFYTSEDGAVWENLFTLQGLVFLGILALLLWGLYAWYQGRDNEQVADQRFNEEVQALKQMDRETVQAYLREKELERQRALDNDDEWNVENYMNYKRENPK